MRPLRVILLSATFPPEPIVSAQTSVALATELQKRGDEVLVLCPFPNRPQGRVYHGFRRRFFRRGTEQGIPVIRCFTFVSRHSRLLSRLAENVSFGKVCALLLLFLKRPDVVYMNSWPLFATGLAMVVCRLRRIPVVLSVQDLYPESLASQRRIPDGPLFSLLWRIDAWISRGAARVVAIAASFRDAMIRRGVDPERVRVIPNWVHDAGRLRWDVSSAREFRERHGVDGETFLVVYAGNMGVASGITEVLQSLVSLRPARPMAVLLAGSGSVLPELTALAGSSRNVRVIIHSPWRESETTEALLAADLLLLSTAGRQSLYSIPSKLMYYMLAGRPILAIADDASEIAAIIRSSGGGWVVAPNRPDRIRDQMSELLSLPAAELAARGLQSRLYAGEHFRETSALPRLVETIDDTARGKPDRGNV